MKPLWHQIVELVILAIPIACIARTVVFEELFKEPREWCKHQSEVCRTLLYRKFFYMLTCEYCFSHYVTIFFLILTRFKLLYPEWWRGYPIAFFALVFLANAYLNLYSRLRVDITSEKREIEVKERQAEAVQQEIDARGRELRNKEHAAAGDGNRPA